MKNERRVVVTGLGVATPLGIGIEPTWDAMLDRQNGIRRIEAFDPGGLSSQVGGELPAFKLGDHIPKGYRKSVKVMSRDITIAVVCAYHAVRDAGLNTKCIIERGEAEPPTNIDSTRFGANIGAGLVCADLVELAGALSTAADGEAFSLKKWGSEGMQNLTPLWLLKFLPNMLACHVTIVHDAQAPSNTVTCGEASSHLAISEAYRTIVRGDADVCICGGAESKLAPLAVTRLLLNGYLNTSKNDSPKNACLPFGENRSGTVASDGGGLVVLESLDHARNRNARIYAEVTGSGAACSTYHWLDPDPKGVAIAIALRKAMKAANVTPDDIGLAVPFGTGCMDFDRGEMAAWNDVFGDKLPAIPALTTRGAMGNNGAGTAAIDFAAAVTAIYRNTIPASLNTDQLDPSCRFQFVQEDPTDATINHCITSSYALAGGQTAALVVSKFKE